MIYSFCFLWIISGHIGCTLAFCVGERKYFNFKEVYKLFKTSLNDNGNDNGNDVIPYMFILILGGIIFIIGVISYIINLPKIRKYINEKDPNYERKRKIKNII